MLIIGWNGKHNNYLRMIWIWLLTSVVRKKRAIMNRGRNYFLNEINNASQNLGTIIRQRIMLKAILTAMHNHRSSRKHMAVRK
mmetsp:Transcript_29361/g.45066  ORF Transcript_29361/g.45066 Transcript_29361/m.45066 type:complete len:83 (-) Transcript_29361:1068-1316(-)